MISKEESLDAILGLRCGYREDFSNGWICCYPDVVGYKNHKIWPYQNGKVGVPFHTITKCSEISKCSYNKEE